GQILATAPSFQQAGEPLLQSLCEILKCNLGEIFVEDKTAGLLRFDSMWKSSNVSDTVRVTPELTVAPGDGLPGRVSSLQAPLMIPQLAKDPSFHGKDLILQGHFLSG